MRLLDILMNLPTLTSCRSIFMELVKASLRGAESRLPLRATVMFGNLAHADSLCQRNFRPR